jgi:hypothetical protein
MDVCIVFCERRRLVRARRWRVWVAPGKAGLSEVEVHANAVQGCVTQPERSALKVPQQLPSLDAAPITGTGVGSTSYPPTIVASRT